QEALRQRPSYVDAHNNLGNALWMMGKADEALACFQQALWLDPKVPEVHWHRSLVWLQLGNYEQGWPEYEWRWKRKRATPRFFSQPRWDGTPLAGKTILLWTEQGLGDTLQFIRYAPLVKESGGSVVVECPQDLLGLLGSCAGIDRLVAEGSPLPEFDVQ